MNRGIIGLFFKSVKTKQGVIHRRFMSYGGQVLLRSFDKLRATADRRENVVAFAIAMAAREDKKVRS